MLAFSGLGHLGRVEMIAEAMSGLGYPPYVMTMLGVAKLLGVATLLAPGFALQKEWAYAGFTINMLGATASHVFAGDPLSASVPPAVLLLVLLASYRLRPTSRRLAMTASQPTPEPA